MLALAFLGTGCSGKWERQQRFFDTTAFEFGSTIVHDVVSRSETQERVIRHLVDRGELRRATQWTARVENWRRATLLLVLAEKWHASGDLKRRDACVRESIDLMEANPKWQKALLVPQIRHTLTLWQDPLLSARLPEPAMLIPREQKEWAASEAVIAAENLEDEEEAARLILLEDDLGLIDHKLAKVRAILRLSKKCMAEGRSEEADKMVRVSLDAFLRKQVLQAELLLRSLTTHQLLDAGRKELAAEYINRLDVLARTEMKNPVSRASVDAGLSLLYAKVGRSNEFRSLAEAATTLAATDESFMPFERNAVLLKVAEAHKAASDPSGALDIVGRALVLVEQNGNLRTSCEMAADLCLFLADLPTEESGSLRKPLQQLLKKMKAEAATREYRRE